MARHIHIFRTIIPDEECISKLTAAMSDHPEITRWHLDLEDVDNILKVETDTLSEANIISLFQEREIVCVALPD